LQIETTPQADQIEEIDEEDIANFTDLEDFQFAEERYADEDDHFHAKEIELDNIAENAIPEDLASQFFDWATIATQK